MGSNASVLEYHNIELQQQKKQQQQQQQQYYTPVAHHQNFTSISHSLLVFHVSLSLISSVLLHIVLSQITQYYTSFCHLSQVIPTSVPQTATRTPRQPKTSCTHAIDEVCSVSCDLHTVYPTSVVLTGSPSCGGDVTVYVYDKSQLSLPIPFYLSLIHI